MRPGEVVLELPKGWERRAKPAPPAAPTPRPGKPRALSAYLISAASPAGFACVTHSKTFAIFPFVSMRKDLLSAKPKRPTP